jgi:hypothetical protein
MEPVTLPKITAYPTREDRKEIPNLTCFFREKGFENPEACAIFLVSWQEWIQLEVISHIHKEGKMRNIWDISDFVSRCIRK